MDKKISQLLPASTPLAGTEVLPIVQSGQTVKATAQDVANLALPYKVYTALLTQSGGSSVAYKTVGNTLDIGVTYMIYDDGGYDFDFTNVGAPNNDFGTYFVATGTTPNSWGISGALQYDTGAPVVTVLENTIGNIWWTYNGVGEYWGNSNNLFSQSKGMVILGTITNNSYDHTFVTNNGLTNSICVITVQESGYILTDGELNNTPIEIRVYN